MMASEVNDLETIELLLQRAEKAERERDEAREGARYAQAWRDQCDKEKRAGEAMYIRLGSALKELAESKAARGQLRAELAVMTERAEKAELACVMSESVAKNMLAETSAKLCQAIIDRDTARAALERAEGLIEDAAFARDEARGDTAEARRLLRAMSETANDYLRDCFRAASSDTEKPDPTASLGALKGHVLRSQRYLAQSETAPQSAPPPAQPGLVDAAVRQTLEIVAEAVIGAMSDHNEEVSSCELYWLSERLSEAIHNFPIAAAAAGQISLISCSPG